jgi:hypothetical protein
MPPSLMLIVPYRARLEHLRVFVPHMETFLRNVRFRIFIVEQMDSKDFNRGMLLNVGYALTRDNAGWVCFHDIDMLPIDDNCDYSLPEGTRHLAGCVEQFGFRMPYPEYFGGVIVTNKSIFERVNGFSNEYWGWGNEDDDLFIRYLLSGFSIERRPGRYMSLHHVKRRQPCSANDARLKSALVYAESQARDHSLLKRVQNISRFVFSVSHNVGISYHSEGLCSLRYEVVYRRRLFELIHFNSPINPAHELVGVMLL